jgi:alpha-tubulin suppressor-like RCC1 family protein
VCPEIRPRFKRVAARCLIALGAVASFAIPVAAQTLAGGGYHSLVLKADGTVWGFGYNGVGELGDGTTTDRSAPVQVSGLTDIVAIAAGEWHSMAITSSGSLYTWGYNTNGQLGDGTTTQRTSPVQF